MTARALEHGLVLLSCGVFGNVIRVLVPLTVEDPVLEEGLGMLEQAFAGVTGEPDLKTGAQLPAGNGRS